MAVPTAASLQKQAIQELLDLVAVDGLPDDPKERLATLQLLAKSDTWVPTFCPETGISLEGIDPAKHAQSLWPDIVPASRMSVEALEREAALYRAAGVRIPVRRA
jgi:hypothetical protein